MRETCPVCGGALQRGFVQSGQRLCWKTEKQDMASWPDQAKGEFYLRGSGLWSGSACPGAWCPACRLILLPQKEEETL